MGPHQPVNHYHAQLPIVETPQLQKPSESTATARDRPSDPSYITGPFHTSARYAIASRSTTSGARTPQSLNNPSGTWLGVPRQGKQVTRVQTDVWGSGTSRYSDIQSATRIKYSDTQFPSIASQPRDTKKSGLITPRKSKHDKTTLRVSHGPNALAQYHAQQESKRQAASGVTRNPTGVTTTVDHAPLAADNRIKYASSSLERNSLTNNSTNRDATTEKVRATPSHAVGRKPEPPVSSSFSRASINDRRIPSGIGPPSRPTIVSTSSAVSRRPFSNTQLGQNRASQAGSLPWLGAITPAATPYGAQPQSSFAPRLPSAAFGRGGEVPGDRTPLALPMVITSTTSVTPLARQAITPSLQRQTQPTPANIFMRSTQPQNKLLATARPSHRDEADGSRSVIRSTRITQQDGGSLRPSLTATPSYSTAASTPAGGSPPSGGLTTQQKAYLYARIGGNSLVASKVVKEAQSQLKAVCVSPTSGRAYKLSRVLQSAIYGGVFEAEVYVIHDVLGSSAPVKAMGRVALKIMLRDLEIRHKDSLQEDITAELRYQAEMRGHKNVLAYDELWESRSKGIIFVVMPFAEFEDLFEVLKRRQSPFSEPEARWLFRQLLEGVKFLHDKGLGFRDHSLENVLMFRDNDGYTVIPKITDPGQAVRLQRDGDGKLQNLYAEKLFGKSFRPPEVYHPKSYNPVKVDVFCMGWMLFFVVTKRQPFDRSLSSDPHWPYVRKGKLEELLRIKGNVSLSSGLLDLLRRMLHPDYKQRPDPVECLQHEWFQQQSCPIDDRAVYASDPNCTVLQLPPHPKSKERRQLADMRNATGPSVAVRRPNQAEPSVPLQHANPLARSVLAYPVANG